MANEPQRRKAKMGAKAWRDGAAIKPHRVDRRLDFERRDPARQSRNQIDPRRLNLSLKTQRPGATEPQPSRIGLTNGLILNAETQRGGAATKGGWPQKNAKSAKKKKKGEFSKRRGAEAQRGGAATKVR